MSETSRSDSFTHEQLVLFDDEDVSGGERRKRFKLGDRKAAAKGSASRKLRLLNDGSLVEVSGAPERETR